MSGTPHDHERGTREHAYALRERAGRAERQTEELWKQARRDEAARATAEEERSDERTPEAAILAASGESSLRPPTGFGLFSASPRRPPRPVRAPARGRRGPRA